MPLEPPLEELVPSLPLEPLPPDELLVSSSDELAAESLEQPTEAAATARETVAGTATHQGKKRSVERSIGMPVAEDRATSAPLCGTRRAHDAANTPGSGSSFAARRSPKPGDRSIDPTGRPT